MNHRLYISALFLVLASTSLAHAEEGVHEELSSMPEQSGFDYNFERTHDKGLYLRLGAGSGFASLTRLTGPVSEESEDVLRVTTALHAGGFIAEGLALHLSHVGLIGARQGQLGLGLGVTMYPNPAHNTFLGLSLGGMTPYDTQADVGLGSQWGMTGELETGFGWWLTHTSALTLSAYGGGSHVDLEGDGVVYVDWRLGIRLSLSL